MYEYDPEVEELDLDESELHTDPPELTKEEAQPAVTDDEAEDYSEGEALGDDLAPAKTRDELEEQEDPDA